MAVKWLELYTFIAGGMDSIPGWGNEIPHAMTWPKKLIKINFFLKENNAKQTHGRKRW